MANVAVTFEMDPTYIPYERPPDPQTLWSVIPRGLRGFIVELGILAAKPNADTESLTLTGTLPANFAYIFSEIHLRLSQDRAADWQTVLSLNLQNWYQGFLGVSSTWNFVLGSTASIDLDARAMSAGPGARTPKGLMWAPRGTSGIQVRMNAANTNATVATAGTISAYINFWEFDLEQARKFAINSPIPTHSR